MITKDEDSWKYIGEHGWWTGGVIQYYETGNKKDYAAWHKEKETFMGWIYKPAVDRLFP